MKDFEMRMIDFLKTVWHLLTVGWRPAFFWGVVLGTSIFELTDGLKAKFPDSYWLSGVGPRSWPYGVIEVSLWAALALLMIVFFVRDQYEVI